MMLLISILLSLFLAYTNGANDNFKGVATLFGSRTTSYQKALAWATLTTFLGSLTAFMLARGLLVTFSGKGLVSDALIATPSFPLAVTLAAGLTVMLATRFGFPISTTHALTGALVGAGWVGSSTGVNLSKLGASFFAPLLVSPLLAVGISVLVYPMLRFVRDRFGLTKESCICVGNEVMAIVPAGVAPGQVLSLYQVSSMPTVRVEVEPVCIERYAGQLMGVRAETLLDSAHFLSAGIVSFARGMNDTPKIAALLLVSGALSPSLAIVGVTLAISLGGLLHSRRVAETMAHRVTDLNAGQGFSANFVTSLVVLFASRLGLPVSTTHVSCGSLFGIAAITGQGRWKTIASILVAWVTTLPIAAALGAMSYVALRGVLS